MCFRESYHDDDDDDDGDNPDRVYDTKDYWKDGMTMDLSMLDDAEDDDKSKKKIIIIIIKK